MLAVSDHCLDGFKRMRVIYIGVHVCPALFNRKVLDLTQFRHLFILFRDNPADVVPQFHDFTFLIVCFHVFLSGNKSTPSFIAKERMKGGNYGIKVGFPGSAPVLKRTHAGVLFEKFPEMGRVRKIQVVGNLRYTLRFVL